MSLLNTTNGMCAFTELIIVIPCYNEPEVLQTIHSLFDCERGGFGVEIILLVNSYSISSESVKLLNKTSFQLAQEFAEKNNSSGFSLIPMLVENLPGHQTGAGLPRRIGMEAAVRRFDDNKKGIIVSLDADTTVDKNYLIEIHRCFKKRKLRSATIKFHHPVDHLSPDNKIRKATEVYEEYLHYYRTALEYIGYPYSYYTIGSAFAVTVETYLQVGGMGKQQAGEDFYFLQKVFPLGKTQFINTTCVYPAARVSDRVPFGTGPAIAKMLNEKSYIQQTYQAAAFGELKLFFDQIASFYQSSREQIEEMITPFPGYLKDFLKENDFLEKMEELNRHTASIDAFKKRFFHYFSAFRILKYLNSVHPFPFEWMNVSTQFSIISHYLHRNNSVHHK